MLERHGRKARLWHNHVLIEESRVPPLRLGDGDYLKVFVGDIECATECSHTDDGMSALDWVIDQVQQVSMALFQTDLVRYNRSEVHGHDTGAQWCPLPPCVRAEDYDLAGASWHEWNVSVASKVMTNSGMTPTITTAFNQATGADRLIGSAIGMVYLEGRCSKLEDILNILGMI